MKQVVKKNNRWNNKEEIQGKASKFAGRISRTLSC